MTTAGETERLGLVEILRKNPQITMERVREYRNAITKKQGENYTLLHPFATPTATRTRLQQSSIRSLDTAQSLRQRRADW